jgi:ATP-dependent DNA ligase
LYRLAPSRQLARVGCTRSSTTVIASSRSSTAEAGCGSSSRKGLDRTDRFRAPFDSTIGGIRHELVIDGEIAVPDERGVTHIDDLRMALISRRPETLAYFAFDLVHLNGRDLRRVAIEDRKALLRDVLGPFSGGRIIYVEHIVGRGADLLERVRELGAEGINRSGWARCTAAAAQPTG